jgi:hypothetical protein
MNEVELEFRQAVYSYRGMGSPSEDELSRPLIITPFEGNYGRAGLIIVINGSPPKGMVICTEFVSDHWLIDAWSYRQKWERVYAPSLHDRPSSGKKHKLGQATIALLIDRGLGEVR